MKTYRSLRATAAAVALLFVCALQSGCVAVMVGAAAAAAAGTVAYVRGDLEATVGAGYEDTLRAVRAGLEKMQYNPVSDRHDAISGEFVARTAKDERVHVLVTADSEKVTKIRIRIGVFGDEQVSRALLDAIKAEL